MSSAPQPVPFSPIPVAAVPTTPPQAVMPEPPKAAAPKKEIPSTPNKVIGAQIILQYQGEDGQIYKAVTTIDQDDYKMQSYSLTVDEKHEKKRDPETRDIIGYEDTGERLLTFKLRYHVR